MASVFGSKPEKDSNSRWAVSKLGFLFPRMPGMPRDRGIRSSAGRGGRLEGRSAEGAGRFLGESSCREVHVGASRFLEATHLLGVLGRESNEKRDIVNPCESPRESSQPQITPCPHCEG